MTQEDIDSIKEGIISGIQNEESLKIYGKSGRGVTGYYIDGRNLYLNTAIADPDGTLQDQDVIEIKDIVGNSILTVTTEIHDNNAISTFSARSDINFGDKISGAAYEIIYYTEFAISDGQQADPNYMYCKTDGKLVENPLSQMKTVHTQMLMDMKYVMHIKIQQASSKLTRRKCRT